MDAVAVDRREAVSSQLMRSAGSSRGKYKGHSSILYKGMGTAGVGLHARVWVWVAVLLAQVGTILGPMQGTQIIITAQS